MSNKYRKQQLPTEVDVNGHDYIFVICGGDSLHNALGVFRKFKNERDYLSECLARKKIPYSRYSISILPVEAQLDQEPYFSIFYNENNCPDGGHNAEIEKAATATFD